MLPPELLRERLLEVKDPVDDWEEAELDSVGVTWWVGVGKNHYVRCCSMDVLADRNVVQRGHHVILFYTTTTPCYKMLYIV